MIISCIIAMLSHHTLPICCDGRCQHWKGWGKVGISHYCNTTIGGLGGNGVGSAAGEVVLVLVVQWQQYHGDHIAKNEGRSPGEYWLYNGDNTMEVMLWKMRGGLRWGGKWSIGLRGGVAAEQGACSAAAPLSEGSTPTSQLLRHVSCDIQESL